MRRTTTLAFAAALALAGCGDGGGPPATPLPGTIDVRFIHGRTIDVVTITAYDTVALTRAELVSPEGTVTPASSIDTTRSPTEVSPSVSPGAPRTVTVVDTIRSVASITLPDPFVYARSWRQWKLRLAFGNRQLEEPAPQPQSPNGA